MQIFKVFRKDKRAYYWQLNAQVDNVRIRRAEFLTRKQAEDAYAAMIMRAHHKRYGTAAPRSNATLGELKALIDTDDKVPRKTRQTFERFVVSIKGADLPIIDLSEVEYRTFTDTLKGLSQNTINRYLTHMLGVLNSAPSRFKDLAGWEPPPVTWARGEKTDRDRLLSTDELTALLAACLAETQEGENAKGVKIRTEMYDMILLMLLLAAREGEILWMEKSQVDWERKEVLITSGKGPKAKRKIRKIPLTDMALDILRRRERADSNRFFTLDHCKILRASKKLGEISGIEYGDRVENGWVFYDLRHAAATFLSHHPDVPYPVYKYILGHEKTEVTEKYTHAMWESIRQAMGELEKCCQILAAQNEKRRISA